MRYTGCVPLPILTGESDLVLRAFSSERQSQTSATAAAVGAREVVQIARRNGPGLAIGKGAGFPRISQLTDPG